MIEETALESAQRRLDELSLQPGQMVVVMVLNDEGDRYMGRIVATRRATDDRGEVGVFYSRVLPHLTVTPEQLIAHASVGNPYALLTVRTGPVEYVVQLIGGD